MWKAQGFAPLRGHTGGTAAITPLAKNSPPDCFLNAPFESLFLQKKPKAKFGFGFSGATGGIRTPDLSVRSRMLYPAELRLHDEQN